MRHQLQRLTRWKIISGGQTGVDRAALDAALQIGLPCGGYVPKGRRTKDGPLPDRYHGMTETDSRRYPVRTRANVMAADGTLILCLGAPEGGTLLTRQIAARAGKPFLVIDLNCLEPAEAVRKARTWLKSLQGSTLNVAGPRESAAEPVYAAAFDLLLEIFG